jgi:nitrite reductase (NADH) small subunit
MTKPDVLVTTRDQIPVGEGRTFIVGGKPIAVFQTHDGGIFATQPHCPHKGGPLADGLLGGTTLMCPLHDRTFDLKTGCGLSHEHLGLATFATRVEPSGDIWVCPHQRAMATGSET